MKFSSRTEESVVLNRISGIPKFICNIVQITIGDVFLFEDVQEQSLSVFRTTGYRLLRCRFPSHRLCPDDRQLLCLL